MGLVLSIIRILSRAIWPDSAVALTAAEEALPVPSEEYRVWYRHSGEYPIDKFPPIGQNALKTVKDVSEIFLDIGNHSITHMIIQGEMPPSLSVIAGNLTHLRLCGTEKIHSLSALTSLEVLDISGNRQLTTLPPDVCQLSTLKMLNLSECGLTELPMGLRSLQQLQTLDIGGNMFKMLPAVVYQLTNLQTLDLRNNKSLEKIDKNILDLRYLEAVGCRGCQILESPPYAVCEQGLPAIRKYFEDIEACSELEITVISVALVGAPMAGKTSIIRSLQTGRRILTNKTPNAAVDETTKVFKMEELALKNVQVMFTEFGDQDVYPIACQLTMNKTYIPCIVLNMEQYDELTTSRGTREATRRLCYDWMSHLYFHRPELSSPILVLTHKDKLSDEKFELRRQELITSTEDIRRELLDDFQKLQSSREIAHLANMSEPLFQEDDILLFSNDLNELENIKALRKCLLRRSKQFQVVIPVRWKRVLAFVEAQSDQPYLLIPDVFAKFPGDDLLTILRHMHNIGKVLWYEKIDSLSSFIFHKIPAITDMIALLFHHSYDVVWKQRVATFTKINYRQQIIEREEYEQLVIDFREYGIMDEAVLIDLLGRDKKFPAEVSLKLLQIFLLIHGPIKRTPRCAFVIPSLSPQRRDKSWKYDGRLQLRVNIQFKGLFLPSYVLHQVNVAVLKLHLKMTNTVFVFQNGCSIHCGEVTIHLLHDTDANKLMLQVSTAVDMLGSSWELFLSTAQHILQQTALVWEAARPVCIFYCAHCLFEREVNPDCVINPGWFQWHSRNVAAEECTATIETFRGVDPVLCRNVWAPYLPRLEVPKPLRFPCEFEALYMNLCSFSTSLWNLSCSICRKDHVTT